MTLRNAWRIRMTAVVLTAALPAAALAANTAEPAQMIGLGTWNETPIMTIGETINGYTPVGIPDGMGAIALDAQTVRIFSNHELGQSAGYSYLLGNGTVLTGGRVSQIDIDRASRMLVDMDPAYDTIYDRYGVIVTNGRQIAETLNPTNNGLDRLCSAWMGPNGYYGLVDDIFFTGEETGDGQEFALDVANGDLWCAPALGRAGWESVTMTSQPSPNQVGMVIGDDRTGAPLLLYIGDKNALGDGSFLDRNGLKRGRLFVWVADNGDLTPQQFTGTGSSRTGTFRQIAYVNALLANTPGYDAQGFANQATQDALGDAVGAFSFSRPEDLATNPANYNQVVLASTGQGAAFPADNWGDTYVIDLDYSGVNPKATIRILYDGDDAGAGQFTGPDFGLRNPDNLDWASDGCIYIQEDRSSTPSSLFGGTSLQEASVWKADPVTGVLTRIAQIDRSAIPTGQVDTAPADRGNWESSGVIDVTPFFPALPNETLLFLNTQAHSLRGAPITGPVLAEGGQYFLLSHIDEPVSVTLASFSALRQASSAVVAWEVAEAVDHAGFHVHRQVSGSERVQLTDHLLSGETRYEFVDSNAPQGVADYWLAEVSRSGEVSWHGPVTLGAGIGVISRPTLAAFPTPFRTQTSIQFSLPVSQKVQVAVYDMSGRRVCTLLEGTKAAGSHEVSWNGRTDSGDSSSAGVYFIKLSTGNNELIQKVVYSR